MSKILAPWQTAKRQKSILNENEDKIMEEMRLQKYLALCSVASRRASEALILDGRVKHCLILELFTTKGIGTMIEKE